MTTSTPTPTPRPRRRSDGAAAAAAGAGSGPTLLSVVVATIVLAADQYGVADAFVVLPTSSPSISRSSHYFARPSTSSSSSSPVGAAFRMRAVLPLRLSSSTDVEPDAAAAAPPTTEEDGETATTNGEEASDEAPWWHTFELADADLPLSIRSDFPILSTRIGAEGTPTQDKKDLIYLDSAATSQKPTKVTDALTRYYHTSNSNVHRGAHCLSREATSQYEGARDAVATFVNAHSRNEIIFTSGATEAINLVAQSWGRGDAELGLGLKEGDEVLITELEHHSNIVPWQMICEETGATLKYIPINVDTQTLDLDALESEGLLNEKTKMVSIQHVSNVVGCVHPLEHIVALTRSRASKDCKILVDACQSLPHMPVDVQGLDIDFLAGSGHKMCGPTGIGFLWGRESLLNSMPPFLGGGEMIDDVTMTSSTYAQAPARFEAGTPAIAQAIGMGAAVDYLTQIGIARIEAYEHELGMYLYRRLDDLPGVHPLGPKPDPKTGGKNRVGLVAFVCDDVHPSDLSTFLDMEGVAVRAGHHCCQPLHKALGMSHSARASLYFYNTKEEIDYFIEKLEETLAFFGSVSGKSAGADGDEGGEEEEEFVPFI